MLSNFITRVRQGLHEFRTYDPHKCPPQIEYSSLAHRGAGMFSYRAVVRDEFVMNVYRNWEETDPDRHWQAIFMTSDTDFDWYGKTCDEACLGLADHLREILDDYATRANEEAREDEPEEEPDDKAEPSPSPAVA